MTTRPAPRLRSDPWDRLPDESDPAWEAFRTYREQGVRRSNAKVAATLGKSVALMNRWSSRYRWVHRASEYDAHLDRQWTREQSELRRKAMERNASAAALAMQKFGQYVITLDVNEVRPGDMARIAQVAHLIEKEALAIPSHVSVQGGGGAPTVDAHLISSMTDEERRSRLRMLLREAETRLAEHGPGDDDGDEVA